MTRPVPGAEAIDPDVDLHVPAQAAEPQAPVLAAVAAGGALGAAARYGLALLWPAGAGAFPWATFWTNAAGCALIGVLMVLVGEGGRTAHPLVRPFLGVGVLGGFTTFSTYAVDVVRLLDEGRGGLALGYAGATVAAALAAVTAAARLTRGAVRGRVRAGVRPRAGGPGRGRGR
ncbi:FluC/FEX family fluoride channel [Streptomyces antimicrobicus]|uniref:Fluoride-specific ion channel FluC n=1 Tax=Streptomyces antimicrobicus TaxID=2883108 RepID=A0ABS8BAD0_9ACTN|nr:CrcB family protein [Streptomyces antimicrobicus]MCB5181570.1 CrcB family protein [Streptomyces antimicrobicus]